MILFSCIYLYYCSLYLYKSILGHVAGNHDNHPDELFTKCAHGELEQDRKWIYVGKHVCHKRTDS